MFRVINCILVISIISLVFTSCKKDEPEVDPCTDGFLSVGEEGIDCGGACAPCAEEIVPLATGSVNGADILFAFKNLSKPDNWYFNFGNDSLNVILNFGDGDSLGTRPIQTIGNSATFNSQSYSTFLGGTVVFAEIDHTNQRLSGFFEAEFMENVGDTLKIEDAEFSNINWN